MENICSFPPVNRSTKNNITPAWPALFLEINKACERVCLMRQRGSQYFLNSSIPSGHFARGRFQAEPCYSMTLKVPVGARSKCALRSWWLELFHIRHGVPLHFRRPLSMGILGALDPPAEMWKVDLLTHIWTGLPANQFHPGSNLCESQPEEGTTGLHIWSLSNLLKGLFLDPG